MLAGTHSGPVLRWQRRRCVLRKVAAGIAGFGALGFVSGILLRDLGAWALLIPVGLMLIFMGVTTTLVELLVANLLSDRVKSEMNLVRIDPWGLTLRGVGPIPWADLEPPGWRNIKVKGDFGGWCLVMALTPQAREKVRRMPRSGAHRVGPKPYLRSGIPYLLLPGVDGLSEDETRQLFQAAHQRFGR